MDTLLKMLQFGGDRRGEEMNRGMEVPSVFPTTDEELLDEFQSTTPSATLYAALGELSYHTSYSCFTRLGKML